MCIYGGGSRREQVNIVTKGVEIVIATPGRLCDLVLAGRRNIRLLLYQHISYVVGKMLCICSLFQYQEIVSINITVNSL